jgi:hypothetical protein
MNYYKPYSYLYKKISDPAQLRSCVVTKIPAYMNLSDPVISTQNNLTTIFYEVIGDQSKSRDWQFEGENLLSWNGQDHSVDVKIGSGSGSTGGQVIIDSGKAEII